MTAHDPLCPTIAFTVPDDNLDMCRCTYIARVRADERERIAQEIEAASEQEACTCHKRYAAIARGEQP